jgi:TctA family transporter
MDTGIGGLMHGFSIALEPHNLLWCFVGVMVGNLVGVLPGMGVLSAISILLPLTFGMKPVAAVLMLSGIYYGAQYGGAICSILLNLPCHPPHAVTCLDGFPMTKQGRGGVALGITMLGSMFGAAFGILQMIFFAPYVAKVAFQFGAPEICALMLLGLLAGSTLAKGSPLKGVAMTMLGLLLGIMGTDVNTGVERFTFGVVDLSDGLELVALSLGLFGIAEFLRSVNNTAPLNLAYTNIKMSDMVPTREDLKTAAMPILRGTLVGSLCSCIPGTGPTIASFVAYATEKKVSKTPERFGHGAIEGVAAPEASTHSSVQGDFIPTMSLGIPGDAVMALLLGALVSEIRFLERTLYPMLVALQSMPRIALAPIIIVWFGFGPTSKIVLGILSAFFPIFLNTVHGLKVVDSDQIALMRSFHATRSQIFWKIKLPNALPFLLAGANIGIIFAILAVIVGEFLGANKGMGYLIVNQSSQMDTPGVFANIVLLSATGLVFHYGLQALRNRLLFWASGSEAAGTKA